MPVQVLLPEAVFAGQVPAEQVLDPVEPDLDLLQHPVQDCLLQEPHFVLASLPVRRLRQLQNVFFDLNQIWFLGLL